MLKRNKLNKTTKEYKCKMSSKNGEAVVTAYSLEDGFFTYYITVNETKVYQDVSECWKLRELNEMISQLGIDYLINQKD